MVAYSFHKSFVEPIRAKTKQQTIRLPRKRNARAGERVQLFTGMRTKACLRIGEGVAQMVDHVRLDFAECVVTIGVGLELCGAAELNDFATLDGFGDHLPWLHLKRWWGIVHPGLTVFNGVLIRWGDSFEATA